MVKLDRLGWAAGVTFTAFSVRAGIRTTDSSILAQIEGLLPPGWKPLAPGPVPHLFSVVVGGAGSGNVRKMWLLYDGWVREARAREAEPVLDELRSAVRLKVAEHAPRRVFVHAGVVGWKGKAILVPGRSHSGKTTLVAALLDAGATYYSDEYAVLDARGRVHPYPTPLSVRDEEGLGVPTDPSEFGAKVGTKSLPLGLVAVTEFKDGATWRPKQLSPAEGALALLENTVSARRSPAAAMAAFRAALGEARIVRSARGDATATARALLEAADAAEAPSGALVR